VSRWGKLRFGVRTQAPSVTFDSRLPQKFRKKMFHNQPNPPSVANNYYISSIMDISRMVGNIDILANPGPEKFNEIKTPTWTIFVKQSFFSSDRFRFWSLRYPGVRGLGCVKNLSWVGVEVCSKFGGDWSGGSRVKEGYRYEGSNSLLYIYR